MRRTQHASGIAIGLAITDVVLWAGGGEMKGVNAFIILPAVSVLLRRPADRRWTGVRPNEE